MMFENLLDAIEKTEKDADVLFDFSDLEKGEDNFEEIINAMLNPTIAAANA